jgi:hypothetical protein
MQAGDAKALTATLHPPLADRTTLALRRLCLYSSQQTLENTKNIRWRADPVPLHIFLRFMQNTA